MSILRRAEYLKYQQVVLINYMINSDKNFIIFVDLIFFSLEGIPLINYTKLTIYTDYIYCRTPKTS